MVKLKCGLTSTIIRFPGGTSNTVSKKYSNGIMTSLTSEMTKLGYFYFDWNCDSGDASGNGVPVATLVNNVKTSSKNKSSVFVLMHDSSEKTTTPQALEPIIKYFAAEGYRFERIDASTPAYHHPINN